MKSFNVAMIMSPWTVQLLVFRLQSFSLVHSIFLLHCSHSVPSLSLSFSNCKLMNACAKWSLLILLEFFHYTTTFLSLSISSGNPHHSCSTFPTVVLCLPLCWKAGIPIQGSLGCVLLPLEISFDAASEAFTSSVGNLYLLTALFGSLWGAWTHIAKYNGQ